jgi:prophage tail gpP-like protein
MLDRVELRVDGKVVEHFKSYRIPSNMFVPADTFSLELGMDFRPKRGARCKLLVNGELELNGIVESAPRSWSKSSSTYSLKGRDMMGMVVDFHLEEGGSIASQELKDLATFVLKDVPYINRKTIKYIKGGKLKPKEDSWSGQKGIEVMPGETPFDVLNRAATAALGALFFALPDGTLVFSKPLSRGKAMFNLVRKRGGRDNNVISCSVLDNISKEYSSVTVMGQGSASAWEDSKPNSFTLENEGFPFNKPYVEVLEEEDVDYAERAALIMSRQRFESYQLTYTVKGHSQGGRNWQFNSICHVDDEIEGVNEDMLIYGRTLVNSKAGATTEVNIARLGVMPA